MPAENGAVRWDKKATGKKRTDVDEVRGVEGGGMLEIGGGGGERGPRFVRNGLVGRTQLLEDGAELDEVLGESTEEEGHEGLGGG